MTFDEIRAGDEIDNGEVYMDNNRPECDEELYFVLYDRFNSTLDNNHLIVDIIRDDVKSGTKTLTRDEFVRKNMKVYRES